MKSFYPVLLAIMLLFSLNTFSQDSTNCSADIQFGADLMSRYIWRGLNLGVTGPSIQPLLKLNVGNDDHMFSLSGWGAYTFSNTANQEVDLIAAYTYKGLLTLMLTDYFFPGMYTDKRDQYFCYNQDSTGHVFEGMIMFNGTAKIPFTLMVATNFYGNDARRMQQLDDTTFVEDGLQYSTYIELGYKKRIKEFDFNAFLGGTVNSPDTEMQETGYYANNKAGFTNIGIKVARGILVTEKYSIPIQVSMIANPLQEKFYIVFGITF